MPARPLADRFRPRTLEEVRGQEHLTGTQGPLRRFYERSEIPSIILWGPPGSGKTTLARILGSHPDYAFEEFSAVLSGVRDVRAVVDRAKLRLETTGRRTLLFVDEIHRFNRAQQDAFLPHVESGRIILVGATTENPSFEVNSALLSRCRTYVLHALGPEVLRRLGEDALDFLCSERTGAARDADRGELLKDEGASVQRRDETKTAGNRDGGTLSEEAWEVALRFADGDARRLLNLLEAAMQGGAVTVSADEVGNLIQKGLATRHGEEDHFDWISALHKSLRGGDPHASLYWLARMLEAGEDPKFIVRRLLVFASEDIGLAEPGALLQAAAAREVVDFVGMPECYLALAQLVLYLSLAPKSNSVYRSYQRASGLVREHGARPVPLRIRNAPTGLMRSLGYAGGYRYPHDHPGHWVPESYLPDGLEGEEVYRASREGREPRMVEDHRRRTGGFYEVGWDQTEPDTEDARGPALDPDGRSGSAKKPPRSAGDEPHEER